MKGMLEENYPSWLVPIYLAKKLKEIGFKGGVLSRDLTLETKEQLSGDLGYCTFTLDDFEEGEIPTWEQVFEWFREKGLHSFIKVFCTNLEFDKRDAERLKNPITFYKYVKGKDALGTFSFSIQNYSEISSYNTFRTYEKCREELVKSLIDDYKKLKIK
jgi:hypothetical protein